MTHPFPNHSHDPSHASREEHQAEIARLRHEVAVLEARHQACRRAGARAEKEREAFMAAFDGHPDMQVWFDREGRILRINQAARMAAGLEEPSPDFTVFNDPVLIMLGVPEAFAKALEGQVTRMPRYAFNPRSIHSEARDATLVLETDLIPVFGLDGAVHSVIVRHKDLTALDEAEREAGRLRAVLDAAGVPARALSEAPGE